MIFRYDVTIRIFCHVSIRESSSMLLRRLLLAAAVSLTAPLIVGCDTGKPVNLSSTMISWVAEADDSQVPGLDSGCIHQARTNSVDIAFFWFDKTDIASNSSSKSGSDEHHFGKMHFNKNAQDLVEWKSDRHGVGSVSFGQQTFDLRNGRLFLIATSGTQPVIRQLDRDLSRFAITPDSVRKIAEGDQEIHEFFLRSAPQKPNAKAGS